jgi:hypothetical protein
MVSDAAPLRSPGQSCLDSEGGTQDDPYVCAPNPKVAGSCRTCLYEASTDAPVCAYGCHIGLDDCPTGLTCVVESSTDCPTGYTCPVSHQDLSGVHSSGCETGTYPVGFCE